MIVVWIPCKVRVVQTDEKLTVVEDVCVGTTETVPTTPELASVNAANAEVAELAQPAEPATETMPEPMAPAPVAVEPMAEAVPMTGPEMAAMLQAADTHLHAAEKFIHESAGGGLKTRITLAKQHLEAAVSALVMPGRAM